MPREFPATCQSDFSSHEPPPRTPSDPPRPLACPFGPWKDWHVNRGKLYDYRRRVRRPGKSERAKIESFILCPTSLVPRNAKQRRGNCHNPIFTHGIFPGVGHAKRDSPNRASMLQQRLATSNNPKKKVWGTFPEPIWEATFARRFLSNPLQLGPRAKTFMQEGHFSYDVQLPESSRAPPSLPDSQQVDPRAQARWKGDTFMHDVELSDRQEFTGSSRNPDRKNVLQRTKNTPVASVRGDNISQAQARIPVNPEPCKSRQRKLSDGTKNVEIRHRELGQIRARTGTRFKKKRARSKMRFSSRTAAFARRVFPTRNKLIREPGCVGKITTPATTWNSRFAESIPRLTGIFTGRTHENSSGTPTSGSHNSLVRTPIHANFIPLERGRREISGDMLHDPF
uniref:Uncharacterized protein n=1 Tax=Fagus sylvatica TaxID=28930 RepID=A0A2N9GDV5_FAGSY